jgi:uridylate kinase
LTRINAELQTTEFQTSQTLNSVEAECASLRSEYRLQAGAKVFRRSRLLFCTGGFETRPYTPGATAVQTVLTRINAELQTTEFQTGQTLNSVKAECASLRSEYRLQAGAKVFRRSRLLFCTGGFETRPYTPGA